MLDLVFATRLTNIELVASKFLVRVIDLCVLVVAGVPALAICLTLGGVMWTSLLAATALTLVMIVFVASLAMLISIGAKRTISAVILTYMALLLVWLALPVMGVLIVGPGAGMPPAWVITLMKFNPAIAIAAAVVPNFAASLWSGAHWICIRWYGGASVLLLILDVLLVRRLGLWASRERVKRERKKTGLTTRERRIRQVWSNPVAWREVRTIAVHRRMRWARILSLLMLLLFSSPLWLGWMADLLDGKRALSWDFDPFCMVITFTATIAWTLMVVQGAVSFAYEREHSTLDALLTTPLRSSYILLGKLAGILRSSAFAVAFPLFFTILAWSRGVISPRAAILALAITAAVALLAACWGLFWSVCTGASLKAITAATTIALAISVGTPMAFEMMGGYHWRFDMLPFSMVSPTQNLSYSVYEPADRSTPAPRPYYYDQRSRWAQWDYRCSTACLYVLIYIALAAGLLAAAIGRMERQYRIDPRLGLALRVRQHSGWKRSGWEALSWAERHRWLAMTIAVLAVVAAYLWAVGWWGI